MPRSQIHKKGFTLLEILIVVAAISILIWIAIPLMSGWLQKSRNATCLANRNMAQRECNYALMNGVADKTKTMQEKQAIVNEIVAEYNTGKYTGGKSPCPCGGAFTANVFSVDVSKMNNSKANPNGVWADRVMVFCSCPEHGSTQWALGQSYKVGDTMISHGYIFQCIRAHTTGTTSRTRDPSLRSNKSTWVVVGFTEGTKYKLSDGTVIVAKAYSSTVRYAVNVIVPYKGKLYARTDFNLVGGQVPYENRDSDYWKIVDPDVKKLE